MYKLISYQISILDNYETHDPDLHWYYTLQKLTTFQRS